MNKDQITYGVIGLVLGIILTWLFASMAVSGQNGNMMRIMGMRPALTMMSSIDQHFIEQMIPHHDDAITMANIALQKAEHTEIKNLAQNVIKTQTEENTKMSQWYKNWFGKDVPDTFAVMGHGMGSGMMHGGMMNDLPDISTLESSQPFDKEFLEQMIPHHQMAVMMAQMLKNSTNRSEMKQLAEDIITAQNKEIEQMRGWYSQWYK